MIRKTVIGLMLTLQASVLYSNEKIESVVKPYPLDVCIVTDNDLGSMGDTKTFIYEGQEIKICCKPCQKKFYKDPARYLKKLSPDPINEAETQTLLPTKP